MKKRQPGYVIVIFLFMVAVLIAFGVMVSKMQRSAQLRAKEIKNVSAGQAAEAGLNAAHTWIREDADRWGDIGTTARTLGPDYFRSIMDANTATAGADVTAVLGPVPGKSWQRKILSVAKVKRNDGNTEVRAIEAILEAQRGNTVALWSNQTTRLGGNVNFEWGPICSNHDFYLSGNAAPPQGWYPRKLATGKIYVNNKSVVDDGLEFFPDRTNLPDIPSLNLKKYREIALTQMDGGNPTNTKGTRVGGSNVYQPDSKGMVVLKDIRDPKPTNPNLPFDDTRVRYVEGNLKIDSGNTYLQGTLIVLGDLTLAGSGAGNYQTPIPLNALDEYKKINTNTPDEFPGDLPGQHLGNLFQFGGPANILLRNGTKDFVTINGFVYTTGALRCTGGQVIHGAAWVNPDGAGTGGSFTIYFRSDLNPLTSQTAPIFTITQIRWVKAP